MVKRLTLLFLLLTSTTFAGGLGDLQGLPVRGSAPRATVTAGAATYTYALWSSLANAISCDGIDDVSTSQANGLPVANNARTMLFWFYDADTTSTNNCPVSYGSSSPDRQACGVHVGYGSTNAAGVIFYGIQWRQDWTRSVGWHHIAMVLPQSGTLSSASLYLDTALNTGTKTYIAGDANSTIDTVTSGKSMYVGALTPGNQFNAKGKICEVSIWNRALTAAEIAYYSTKTLSGLEPGLVRYYPCNEGAGRDLADMSGHPFNAVITGGTWSTR